MDHAPSPGTIIDAWLDGLATRVASGHRVACQVGDDLYLDRWTGTKWVRSHDIPATASWRVAHDPEKTHD